MVRYGTGRRLRRNSPPSPPTLVSMPGWGGCARSPSPTGSTASAASSSSSPFLFCLFPSFCSSCPAPPPPLSPPGGRRLQVEVASVAAAGSWDRRAMLLSSTRGVRGVGFTCTALTWILICWVSARKSSSSNRYGYDWSHYLIPVISWYLVYKSEQ